VRNYSARNNLREMKKGDLVFFYHSNADPTAVVGIAEVVREAYPDADPTWSLVDVKAVKKLERPVSLSEIKQTKALQKMALVRQGRLSVQPVSEEEFELVKKLSEGP
jgi:predicted RNA-binding protein with PUA-like domain